MVTLKHGIRLGINPLPKKKMSITSLTREKHLTNHLSQVAFKDNMTSDYCNTHDETNLNEKITNIPDCKQKG